MRTATGLLLATLLVLGGCARQPAGPLVVVSDQPATITASDWATEAPAGEYQVEPSHASLTFRVDHLGFSNYTARFKRFDGTLQFDPANPAATSVEATVDVRSLETDFPYPEKVDFNAELLSEAWLDAKRHPTITYRSTGVELTGAQTMTVRGELVFRGITKPLDLEARFNGGYAGHPLDPNARIGFSARGKLRRSDFGMTVGIPAAGTKLGVGDEVEVIIEVEFTGPPLPQAP